jgi:hypothetical protein
MARITIRKKSVRTDDFRQKLTKEEANLLPPVIKVPDDPTVPREGESKDLHDEQQVWRVEILMTKGIRDRRLLSGMLDIKDYRVLDRYISRVHARWEMTGTQQDHARNRGEGLRRLDLIESELWAKLQNQEDARVSNALLNTILNVQRQRGEMLGLTPKVIERIGSIEAEGATFTRQAIAHDRLTMLAQRMMTLIEDRAKTIDQVPNENRTSDIQPRDE